MRVQGAKTGKNMEIKFYIGNCNNGNGDEPEQETQQFYNKL